MLVDGRYRIEELIGEGGMGLVYRAMHMALNKPVAIKVLQREASQDEEVLARFTREAQSASSIGNQHIVDVSDFGVLEDGAVYFTMEYLEGEDLIEAIDSAQRMSSARAIHIAKQVCRALSAAHGVGIVHRDLKPENVFLIRQGEDPDFVKILDFGIAKVADGQHRLTRAGEVFGTPHYMSPEQCQGQDVDARTDIYALGVLLYEMVTGDVPHDADTMMGILTKQLYEDPVPPSIKCAQVPAALEQVIMRCLFKDPGQRYPSMAELLADLERVEQGAEVRARPMVAIRSTRPPARRRVERLTTGLGFAAFALLPLLVYLALSFEEPAPLRVSLVADDTSNSVAVGPLPVEPHIAAPTLLLDSKPQGAEVWADGRLQGQTPLELGAEALSGSEIVLVRTGYQRLRIDPSALPPDGEPLFFELERVKAKPRRSVRARRPKPKPAKKSASSTQGVLVDPWSAHD
jgi:predicted Ser/Thr protein kinase